ncbi:LysM peptidoglycan-binding domain-containing M23 family metallopeptidase [Maledivibacter halophilus]|uniref:Murein DD-endopeptidase MepM and murein hydrolase activator NlpD, contain LysM domain n=1 Tax=Maledivibacter halophilus TaxID=36842 RepID=A0A1T5MKF7_9FIRM|nr:M23 family metallopeptidase [Maledivibacter halophilus]SKC88398.1 Murein DD-endopeptidase MepM and murein hydrolase activator NlpD, contain LysM domain [Maledivibacter halophilus]
MANSGNSGSLKNIIEKFIRQFKDSRQAKIFIFLGTIGVFFLTLLLAFPNKSYNNRPIRPVKGVQLEKSFSNRAGFQKREDGLKSIANIKEDVEEILKVRIPVYALNVNGKDLAVFKTKDEASNLLDDIVKPFTQDEEAKIEEIGFKENTKIVKKLVGAEKFAENLEYGEILDYITKGTKETKIHKMQKGENYWVIAQKYKINPDDLIKANPGVKPETLQIGQEISLVVPKPLITVVTKEIMEYNEEIAYETKYEETEVLYKGEVRVKMAGEKGEREVKAKINKENGIEIERSILEEKIIAEPTTKVVLKGTKNPPPKIGTGKLAKPTSRGILTSPFGWRWGRRHSGIDIGIPTGTDVKAADGGKVIFSGTKGGYGKCIIIDHGGNVNTLYAHNSELLVKKGTKVFKGQIIAKSGNTGVSTGPHLHFEVRKNNTPVNPAKYVKY